MNSVPKVSVASCTGCRAPALRLATVSAQRLSAVSELTTHSRSPALLLSRLIGYLQMKGIITPKSAISGGL